MEKSNTLSRRQAASTLGISERSVDRMVAQGALRSFMLPGCRWRLFQLKDLEKLLSQAQQQVQVSKR